MTLELLANEQVYFSIESEKTLQIFSHKKNQLVAFNERVAKSHVDNL
jgi:hypothetical protein